MTHTWRTLVAALATFATAAVAEAQTCLGLAPFSAGRVRVGANVDFGNDATAFSSVLVFGSPAGAFGGPMIGTVDYENFDGNTTAVGALLGWQAPIGTAGRVQLCPVGVAVYGFGPDDVGDSGSDVSSLDAHFGLQVGVTTGTNARVRLIPTAGAALAYSKVEFDGGLLDGFDDSETFGILSAGLGFVVNSRVSVLPRVDIPVGLDDADPVFGIMVAVNFGRRS